MGATTAVIVVGCLGIARRHGTPGILRRSTRNERREHREKDIADRLVIRLPQAARSGADGAVTYLFSRAPCALRNRRQDEITIGRTGRCSYEHRRRHKRVNGLPEAHRLARWLPAVGFRVNSTAT